MKIDAHIPSGPLEDKWEQRKRSASQVSPANKRKFKILVVGTGLAGASAGATLADLGYQVEAFTYNDSARRAHSIAAQGGINASKNYQNDGDSVYRLFNATIKGGDYRAREANVYRLAEVSGNIIDQCVALGVPFAREYGGYLANRSFGGALVSRTFYARGQTGQQLLIGAYSHLARTVGQGALRLHTRKEMQDVVIIGGHARGIIVRDLVTGKLESYAGDAVILATGGYSNVFYLSTNAKNCNATAIWKAYKRGAGIANLCYTQIHPTCIPQSGDYQSKLTLMSESLRNDGRIWVPAKTDEPRAPDAIPEDERDYYLERLYPAYGNLAPRDISSRAGKRACDEGRGVGPGKRGVYLDFAEAISRLGKDTIRERYGNLFDMYERITGENPYSSPMRIYPATHYTMGGLWVDYNLMSTIPGLFVAGEANFSDHGANRLGASALMQGLADGYFVLPNTIGDYLANHHQGSFDTGHSAFMQARDEVLTGLSQLVEVKGTRTVDNLHRELGAVLLNNAGISRSREGLTQAIGEVAAIREAFYHEVLVPGRIDEFNPELEKAARMKDFLELGELMCRDALLREESCGGHFREEYQTDEGEALRDDENFAHVAVFEYAGEGREAVRHTESLDFERVHLAQRSYK